MPRTPLSLPGLIVPLLVLAPASQPPLDAQAPPHIERAVSDSGLTITCEVYCSDTKLRTANARIRWHASKDAPEAARLATAPHRLQVTVFYQGFEKNQYVTVPIGEPGTPAPRAAGAAPDRRPLRAYQFQVIETERPRTTDVAAIEQGVVLEGLEPGINYSWRVVAETAAGNVTSAVVMCQAPVCPADMVDEPRPRPVGARP